MHQLAVSIILYNQGKVFLAKRSANQEFAAGIWEFPAGRMENGESLQETLQREAQEELNIIVEDSKVVDVYTFDRGTLPLALISYFCTYSGDIQLSEEHEEGKWVQLEDAKNYFSFDLQKRTVVLIQEYLHNILESIIISDYLMFMTKDPIFLITKLMYFV